MGCGASKVAAEPVVATPVPKHNSTGGAKAPPVPAEITKPEALQPGKALQEDAEAAAMESASASHQAAASQKQDHDPLSRKPDWLATGRKSTSQGGALPPVAAGSLPPLKAAPPAGPRVSAGFNPRRSAGGGAMDDRPPAVRMSQPGVVESHSDSEPEPDVSALTQPSPELLAMLSQAAAPASEVPVEDPAHDPWQALQAQYKPAEHVEAAVSSPVRSSAGGGGAAAAARLGRSPGSKRTTKEETVLVDGSDGSGDEAVVQESTHTNKGRRGKPAAAGPVKGGWGAGDLAAAGTIMTGTEEAGAARDGVFDESDDEAARGGRGSGAGVKAATARRQQQGAEVLGLEEVEDLDEPAAAEMAAAGAMSKDLAAKLAQFEAMNEDD